jgi:malonate-semialdehyde dehydrogenase (acetylating)/methylmalonate-semialdehyde dehydrogenase
MRTKTVDEAIAIENSNPYGNAASVFTQNGWVARYIIRKSQCRNDWCECGCTCSREPFSFGGWNESKFGVGDITGKVQLSSGQS